MLRALGDYTGITSHASIGGQNTRDDMKRLESGCNVVVGTPDRVHDMINRRALGKYLMHSDLLTEYLLKCVRSVGGERNCTNYANA